MHMSTPPLNQACLFTSSQIRTLVTRIVEVLRWLKALSCNGSIRNQTWRNLWTPTWFEFIQFIDIKLSPKRATKLHTGVNKGNGEL